MIIGKWSPYPWCDMCCRRVDSTTGILVYYSYARYVEVCADCARKWREDRMRREVES